MKTRIVLAVASLLAASLGTAYAQTQQQATPTQTPPKMPQQQPASPMKSAAMNHGQANGNMSATQIERQVKRELTSHGVTATDVNVAFDNGTATLTGTVYNQRDIAKAKNAAMRVRGVKQVDTSNLHARKSGSQHGQG